MPTVHVCRDVLFVSAKRTKSRPGATMEVWPPDPSARPCLACVEPSRGEAYSRVGGAGSAPPHDRSPAFGISKRLGKRRRWGVDVGSRLRAKCSTFICRGELCSPGMLQFSCSSVFVQGCTFSLARKYQRAPGGHNGGVAPGPRCTFLFGLRGAFAGRPPQQGWRRGQRATP